MRTLRAAGMVQEPAALWPPGRPLSSSPGGAGGLGLPGGSQGPGRARLPLRACTTRVSGICCCWLPTREGEPRGDWAAMLRTRQAGTAAKHPWARPPHAGPQAGSPAPSPPGRWVAMALPSGIGPRDEVVPLAGSGA